MFERALASEAGMAGRALTLTQFPWVSPTTGREVCAPEGQQVGNG